MPKYAMSCFLDSEGFLHDAESCAHAFDGWEHHNRPALLFTFHPEYEHQKYIFNEDGTISLKRDPEWVFGSDGRIGFKFVKKDSEHKLVFDEIANHFKNKKQGE